MKDFNFKVWKIIIYLEISCRYQLAVDIYICSTVKSFYSLSTYCKAYKAHAQTLLTAKRKV